MGFPLLDQFANVLSLTKLQILFLENYYPCHSVDIQKTKKIKRKEINIQPYSINTIL